MTIMSFGALDMSKLTTNTATHRKNQPSGTNGERMDTDADDHDVSALDRIM